MVYEREEAVRGAVECVDRAAFDIVDPAVQRQPALLEREPYAGMRLEVGELRDHVLAYHRFDLVACAAVLARLVDNLRGVRVAQPAGDGRHVIHAPPGPHPARPAPLAR